MLIERLFPFVAAPSKNKKDAIDVSSINPSKLMKVKTLGLGFHTGWINLLGNKTPKDRANFEAPLQDFDRIIEAIDTDSYIKQAFFKYKELFWKEGWEITGENYDSITYLYQRIDFIEEVMKRPFNDFLMEAIDQLFKFNNVFIVIAKADIQPYYPGKLNIKDDDLPIAGYYVIPTETVRIYRDKNNRPIAYKQQVTDTTSVNFDFKDPVFDASEVIHLYWDKKPGYAFATPFIISVLDDVVALRQIEQDLQNLIHNELFPIYQVKVGTESMPADPDEVEQAADTIANMRVEGGLVTPERYEISVIGSEGHSLDISDYLQHFKERVAVGMGLSTHHLGMLGSGANRSVTDRLDIALYDKIKLIQSYVEECIRLYIFNPLLREGGFDPSPTPHDDSGLSDRCYMRFKEIDIDTQIKKENHSLNKFNSNAITLEELRMDLGESQDFDPAQLLMAMTAQIQAVQQEQVIKATPQQPKSIGTGADGKPKLSKPPSPEPVKPDAIKPSTGGVANLPNTKKKTGNLTKPSNQFGRKMSPSVRHMDENVLDEIVSLLEKDNNE